MIITIARECGAGGEVIGKLLSEKFNIPFYSWQTLVEMAKEKGLYEDMPTFFTEDPMNSLIYALSVTVHSDKVKKTPLNALAQGRIASLSDVAETLYSETAGIASVYSSMGILKTA